MVRRVDLPSRATELSFPQEFKIFNHQIAGGICGAICARINARPALYLSVICSLLLILLILLILFRIRSHY